MKNDNVWQTHSNWLGKLELNFSLKRGRSVLTRCSHSGPFFIQKSFYPKKDNATPHVYLLHPPGGLVGGDKLILSVQLEPHSQALLTTPSSTKFYRTNGVYALQEYVFKLQENAVLEWIPQSNIFFPKTKTKIRTIFILEQGARIIAFEMFCFQHLCWQDWNKPDEVDIWLNISFSDMIGLRDRLRINTSDCITKLHGFQISAVFYAAPVDRLILQQIRKLIQPIPGIQIGGATLLNGLLVVRLLGNDNQKLVSLLHHIWSIVRLKIIGKKPVFPRVWCT